ncbi:hypothetical protein L596_006323 [Steinernema carpocapsae]|uniref:Uncharacterized protein n=1 Tax=Steinernema carpocapsae TaxID=34508 RepID=A0A4U8V1Q6_STECR|nr:hypothetical protein L596_006323 [Steinernema carpocapsae]
MTSCAVSIATRAVAAMLLFLQLSLLVLLGSAFSLNKPEWTERDARLSDMLFRFSAKFLMEATATVFGNSGVG